MCLHKEIGGKILKCGHEKSESFSLKNNGKSPNMMSQPGLFEKTLNGCEVTKYKYFLIVLKQIFYLCLA